MENIRNNKQLKKFIRNRRGELLIESMASFVILIIILAAATGMIIAGINMNRSADDKSAALGKAVESVEQFNTSDGQEGTMKVQFSDKTITENIAIKQQDNILYFSLNK